MKNRKILLTAICGIISINIVIAQDKGGKEDDFDLNTLQAPSSPAANLIGTSPTQVQTFTDPSAFMIAVQNGAENFTGFPNSYSVDVAPAWLIAGSTISMDKFESDKLKHNVWQSLVLSFAYTNTDSLIKHTNMGLGFKISLLRGDINDKARRMLHLSDSLLSKIITPVADDINSKLLTDPFIQSLRQQQLVLLKQNNPELEDEIKEIAGKISSRMQDIQDIAHSDALERNKEIFDSLRVITESIDFKRTGFKVDVAGGVALDFPGQVFNYSKLSTGGMWVTFGYDFRRIAVMGILRYMHNPDKVYFDKNVDLYKLNTLDVADAGCRLQYESSDGKFQFGGEVIYRSVLNISGVSPVWRYVINSDYEIKKNTHVTVTLGRDFDGTFNKSGSLITAINLLFGIGNTRDINDD